MTYLMTLFVSVISVYLYFKTSNIYLISGISLFLILYGVLLFPNIDSIVQGITWRMQNTGGAITFQFDQKTIEPSWTNPKYWNLKIKSMARHYWWAVWPAYSALLYYIARLIK